MRDLLNVIAHVFGQASGSNSTRDNQSCTKRARHDENIRSLSSTGVVALPNGKWAAHVYVNNNWICLGVFKTEKEAVIAYESRTLNTWMECCKSYLQMISSGAQEPLTLKQPCITGTPLSTSVNISQVPNCIRTHLFTKVLTSSDVSKISRLVIPKIFAGCFPCISDENESSSELQSVNKLAVDLAFYDLSMTMWNFQYCYCKKSKTYSFSKGWRKFVEKKDLRPNDKVIFFKGERVEAMSDVTHFMIDVEYDRNRVQVEQVGGNTGDYVVPSHSEGVQNLQNEENGGGTADVANASKIEAHKYLEGAGAGTADVTNVSKIKAGKNMEGAGGGTADVTNVSEIEAGKDLEGTGAGKAPDETGIMLFGVKIA